MWPRRKGLGTARGDLVAMPLEERHGLDRGPSRELPEARALRARLHLAQQQAADAESEDGARRRGRCVRHRRARGRDARPRSQPARRRARRRSPPRPSPGRCSRASRSGGSARQPARPRPRLPSARSAIWRTGSAGPRNRRCRSAQPRSGAQSRSEPTVSAVGVIHGSRRAAALRTSSVKAERPYCETAADGSAQLPPQT